MSDVFTKIPSSIIDFTINWNDGYLAAEETVATSMWTVTPTTVPPAILSGAIIAGNVNTTIFMAGGLHGVTYVLKNTIVTNGARTDSRVLRVTAWEGK